MYFFLLFCGHYFEEAIYVFNILRDRHYLKSVCSRQETFRCNSVAPRVGLKLRFCY